MDANASDTGIMFTCLWNFLDWLDQPVTNSSSAMDSKKIVQAPVTGVVHQQQVSQQEQPRGKGGGASTTDGPGISGVRRRSGPQQGLRSPAAKRPVSAPVALQGWLHKQGSEGLMLWKKRWFVLSEYCLFYYKGPEEEKLLGSILLPSYRVTVCRPEDKVTKKFAFKAEHANMRTYHFAAESRESMNQWVNALTLASLLQDPNPGGGDAVVAPEQQQQQQQQDDRSARPSVSSISSIMNQSADDSDSGFHGFQSRDDPSHASNNNSSPNSGSFPSSGSSKPISNNINNNNNNNPDPQPQPLINGWMQQYRGPPRNYGQPVYANAPPKPRRLNENAADSPDPGIEYGTVYGQRAHLRTDKSGLTYGYVQSPSERRTPDTYGRSKTPNRMRNGGLDYEDVYANPPPQLYQRPAGPVGYTKGPAPTPIPMYNQVQPQYYVVSGTLPNGEITHIMRQQHQPQVQQPPRPHSADFLEYEAARNPQTPTQVPGGQPRCHQRPKSSLDVVNPADVVPPNDNYFYSEERYAAQMRQSAVYLHQPQAQQQQQQQSRNQSLSRATTPSKSTPTSREPDTSDVSCGSLARRTNPGVTQGGHQTNLQRHNELTTSEAAHMRRSLRETRSSPHQHLHHQQQSPGRSLPRDYNSHVSAALQSGGRRWEQSQQQQFARSASARLPRSRHPAAIIDYDDDEDDDDSYDRNSGQGPRDGERKIQQREESMKRLLEWKQRMLQSPLTRKPVPPSSLNGTNQLHNADLANCYKQQALLELAAHEASLSSSSNRQHRRRGEEPHQRSHYPRSKSTDARRTRVMVQSTGHQNNLLPRYSSYSSDDEASGSGSVIGRDPLPPRAVSTSQLARTQEQSNGNVVVVANGNGQVSTTLPRSSGVGAVAPASSGGNNRQPMHHKTSTSHRQHQQQLLQSTPHIAMIDHGESDYANHILKAASSGDVRMLNELRDPRIGSPGSASGQRHLVSPTNHLRVISPSEHHIYGHHQRVSSPSDSERQHAQSLSDRGCSMSSPIIGRDSELRASNPSLRQTHRGSRHSGDQLVHKRSQSARSRSSTRGSTTSLVQVSAGELLNRTHEELVLLLIQLRRQSATLCKAIETCHMEIAHEAHEAQARLVELDTPRRLENLQKLEELKKHLMDLEKQYEKGKPLVNLVDNMVKLGSLYNCNGKQSNGTLSTSSLSGSRYDLLSSESAREHRDRLEFNQRLQEQRLLAEERRDWDRLSPDHGQLQAKVQQLYKLDQLLQEESGTLHSLQQNKELLEKALGGLRHKMQGCSRNNPAEAERYREQQLLLERELSRVRLLLAHNSKKLEETVAENARLEQDLMVLRQKLQASRRYTGNVPATATATTTTNRDSTSGTSAALEKELRRVQQLVGDLQRQRQELSVQVKQLTEKSHSLVQQIKPQATSTPQVHQSSKKRTPSSWLETDLDSGLTQEHSVASSPALSTSKLNGRASPYHPHHLTSPQYNQACSPGSTSSSSSSRYGRQVQGQASSPQNGMTSLSPQLREQIQQHQLKQQLLKDQMQGKSSSPIQQNNNVPLYVNAMVPDPRRLDRNYEHINGGPMMPPEYVPPPPPPPCEETIMMNGAGYGHDDNKFSGLMQNREKQEIKTVRIVKRESERRQRDRGDRSAIGIPLANGQMSALPGGAKRLAEDDYGGSQQFETQLDRVIEESPMMHAQSSGQLTELDDAHFQRSMSLPRGFGGQNPGLAIMSASQQLMQQHQPVPPPPRSDSMIALRNIMAKRQHRSPRGMGRARDDLDMERALRPRINAPDVVRSTLSHKELKYNESTIDSLLGTPNKIVIPERYVPEKTPELTAEEKEQRLKKAESIRKMLSETTIGSADGAEDETNFEKKKKVAEEKRQREHILQLNQILAKQVMEKSKMVAANALHPTNPFNGDSSIDDDDTSPLNPLPLYQQRENFYS